MDVFSKGNIFAEKVVGKTCNSDKIFRINLGICASIGHIQKHCLFIRAITTLFTTESIKKEGRGRDTNKGHGNSIPYL